MPRKHRPLEAMRGRFFLIGFVIACSSTLLAFEWTTFSKNEPVFPSEPPIGIYEQDEVDPPRTIPDKPRPTPPKTIIDIIIIDPNPQASTEQEPEFADPEEIELEEIAMEEEVLVEEPMPQPPTRFVGVMPQFPGGEKARQQFLKNNVKYPEFAKVNGIEGSVFIEFIVGRDGKLSGFTLLNQVHPTLAEEAMRVAMSMPDWIPGRQGDHKVAVYQQMRMNFILH